MNRRRTVWLLALLLGAGCVENPAAPDAGDPGDDAPRLQEGRLLINNDRAELDARVNLVSKLLFIRAIETPDRERADLAQKSVALRLVQRGEILPPVVDANLVQANDIDISGQIAAVAYNYAGDVFAGAVQVIDFTHPTKPRLLSEVLYPNADVTAVLLHDQTLYVGSGSLDPALATPALLEEFLLSDAGLESTGRWLDMPSWVVTDLSLHGHDVMASVGRRDGGVALIDCDSERLRMAAFVYEEDVRGIDFPTDGQMAAVCGTNPRMAMMSVPGFGRLGVHEIDGYNYPNAKGTIEAQGGVCFLGAGDGGFQVRGPDGGLLSVLRHEDFSDVRPELMVTNAVSLHGELAFVAGGALGVQVVKVAGAHGWAEGGGYDPDGLQVLGELAFEDGLSSNMVKTRNNVMVVAAGVGGVKLVTMSGQDE